MEDIGANIDEISMFVDDFAKRAGYGRVVSLGTSGGSLVAIYSAVRFDWSKAVAVGPAVPSRYSEFAAILKTFTREKPQPKTKLLIETSNVARDVDASNQLKQLFPSLSVHVDRRFTDHNLINELYECGELQNFPSSVVL